SRSIHPTARGLARLDLQQIAAGQRTARRSPGDVPVPSLAAKPLDSPHRAWPRAVGSTADRGGPARAASITRGRSRPLSRGKAARFTPPRVASRGWIYSRSRRASARRVDHQGTFPSPLSRQSRSIHPTARGLARLDLQQIAAGQRTAHLGQRLLLELADPLARQVVLVADLLERQLLLGLQAEALAQDVGLDRAQLAEQLADLGGQRLPLEIAGRRHLLAIRILEHLAEHAALVVADRLVDRDRLLEEPAAHLLDLVDRHVGRGRELLARRLAAELAGELAARLGQPVLRVDHVDGQ